MPQIKTITTTKKVINTNQLIITISNSIKGEGYKVIDHNKRVILFLLSRVQQASVQLKGRNQIIIRKNTN